MRGNRAHIPLPPTSIRSIPAHAGQPETRTSARRMIWVYPRACGATAIRLGIAGRMRGLSPRMRGNHQGVYALASRPGSIPAHAGQPRVRGGWRDGGRVYPRACGATQDDVARTMGLHGLSPRMRGNLDILSPAFPHRRSIPAHAGQPKRILISGRQGEVYPRACGATCCISTGSQ